MSTTSHLESLYHKHSTLEREIKDAYVHHQPVAELKKEKLRVKDEIQQFLKASNENVRREHASAEAA